MDRVVLFLNRFFRPPRVGGRDSDRAYSEWENREGRGLVKKFLEPYEDINGKKVLDVGCGLGGKTVAYGEGGAYEVIGVDILERNVMAARDFALSEARTFRWAFIVGDAGNLPIESEVIDTVVANDAMEHFRDPRSAVRDILRVLKRGGAVWFFFTPHFSPLGSHLYDYIYIPWCHLFLGRRRLEKAIRAVLRKREGNSSPMEIEQKVREIMRSYDEDLNHMTVRRFFKMIDSFPSLEITFRRSEPPKFKILKFLTNLPFLRELFTATVICRAKKVG